MQRHSFPTTWQSQSGSWRKINPQLHFTHSRLRAQLTPPLQNTNMNTNTNTNTILALERNQTANKVLSLSSFLNYTWRSSFLHLLDLCIISGTQLCFQRWDSKEVQGEIKNKKRWWKEWQWKSQQMLSILVKSLNRAESQVGKNASKKERFSKNILSGGCAGSLSLVFVQSIDYTRCTK